MKRSCAVLAIVAAAASSALAQVPAGPEFHVVLPVSLGQWNWAGTRELAVAPNGSFVVVFDDNWRDMNSVWGVYARRFDAAGTPLGLDFHVNTYTTGAQRGASVAVDADGGFVVVWQSETQDGSGLGIVGRRFDTAGLPVGSEFIVNAGTTGDQVRPCPAMDAAGNFIVVWASHPASGPAAVFARMFDTTGAPRGGEIAVGTLATLAPQERGAWVDADAAGNFVVVWTRDEPGAGRGVTARRFDSTGNALGPEFAVNTNTSGDEQHPSAAFDGQGGFTVVWTHVPPGSPIGEIHGQRYDAAGAALGAEFSVHDVTPSYSSSAPTVDADASGNFVVAFDRDGGFVSGPPRARRFDASGAPRGAEFQVNTTTLGREDSVSVASDPAGNFVAVWSSVIPFGITPVWTQGQRFGGLVPSALVVDDSGNRVIDPGETAVVAPAWRNLNGAAQTFGGALSGIDGPPGMTYTITDAAASYGTVLNGATVACTDCYGIALSNPPARPQTHIDASVVETITPDAHGQVRKWTLHVGGSFTDVDGGNPFYPFVETLLHHGITGGCTTTAYCPASPTSREQMAVFVLVGKKGGTFVPPPCGATPIFADVPASSPFCRWIEELSRRGVVSGCGGGNYCPASDVTREQMSVFVLRTLDPVLIPPACGTPMFNDVPASSAFCPWIEELARRGVVTGCGGGNYCPDAPVTREQMGVFISVTFGLTLYGP